MISVRLEAAEIRMAAIVGIEREARSLLRRSPDTIPTAHPWEVHIIGAQGELAFAKATNRFWSGSFDTFHDPDLTGRLQIRTTERRDGCLIVRPADDDLDRFVLVIATPPVFLVIGWILGIDAKRPGFLRGENGPPAWFVPQVALRPIFPAALPAPEEAVW
jgi:hypothetical protein